MGERRDEREDEVVLKKNWQRIRRRWEKVLMEWKGNMMKRVMWSRGQRNEGWGLKVHLSEEMITERRKANGWWWRCFVIKCFLLPNLSFQCSQLLHTPFVFSLFLSPPPALFFLLYLSFELMFFPLSFSTFGSSFSCFSLIYIPFIFCFVPLFPLSFPFLSHA